MINAGTFPYRAVAEDGLYAGTTFIYQADGSVVEYRTASPDCYFRTGPSSVSAPLAGRTARFVMTPEALARFESVPLREARTS